MKLERGLGLLWTLHITLALRCAPGIELGGRGVCGSRGLERECLCQTETLSR